MVVLSSNISIGKYTFKVNDVHINMSLNSYMDKAVVKIPISGRIKQAGELSTESVQTAQLFTEGDKVLIDLGYDGDLENEFEGFVHRVNFTSPVEIECEGFAWQLRHKSLAGAWQKITVKELLTLITAGTDIVLDSNIPDIPIENFTIPEQPLLSILDYLKEHCMLSIWFQKNVLFANLKYTTLGNEVKHVLGVNVIKDNDLKLRQKSKENNIQVNFSAEKKDGTKVKGTAGAGGGKVINRRTVITDADWLAKVAEKKLAEYSFDGYEGKITTFLKPYTKHGDVSNTIDNRYSERSGKYIIESKEVQFGRNGARRINELGIKVS